MESLEMEDFKDKMSTSKKNSLNFQNKASQSKIMFLALLGVIFLLPLISAANWDNKGEFHHNNEDTDGYFGRYEIYDSWILGMGKGDKLVDMKLTTNTQSCGTDCLAELTADVRKDGSVIDDIRFFKIEEDGSRHLGNIRGYKIKVAEVDDDYLKDKKEKHKHKDKKEKEKEAKEHHEEDETLEWENYNLGEELEKGNYIIRIEGKKKPSWTYDWQIKTQGIWSEEWALWSQGTELLINDTNSYTTDSSTDLLMKTYNLGSNVKIINFSSELQTSDAGSSVVRIVQLNYLNGSSYNNTLTTFTNTGQWVTKSFLNPNPSEQVTSINLYLKSVAGSGKNVTSKNQLIYGTNGSIITLNSPSNNYYSPSYDVTFNASAEVVGGATITNMSLWTNSTGVWALNQTNNFEGYNIFNSSMKSGLSSYYKLDEQDTTGTGSLIDEQGNYDGTNVGATNTSGKINTAYSFDGVNDYLNGISNINPSNIYSFFAWIYVQDNISNSISSFGKHSGCNPGNNAFQINANGKLTLTLSCEDPLTYGGTTQIQKGQWYHVGYTYNPNGTINTYINGNLEVSRNYATGSFSTGAQSNVVGALYSGGTLISHFNGTIDEIGIWNRTLTLEEINYLYNGTTSTSTQTFDSTISETTIWNVQACDSDGDCGFALSNRTVYLDATFPVINQTYPLNPIYHKSGNNLTINYTVTDTNLNSCWYDYSGTNVSIANCSANTFNFTVTDFDNKNLTFYANDTAGNLNSSLFSWSYGVFENSRNFSSSATEGSTEYFVINISYDSSTYLSISPEFVYNGTSYTGPTPTGSGDNLLYNGSITIPSVSSDTNMSFYWNFTLSDGSSTTYSVTEESNQTVNALGGEINITTGTCGSGTFEAMNFSFKDAGNLSSNLVDVSYNIKYGVGNLTLGEYYGYKNNTNILRLCINSTIENLKIGYGELDYDDSTHTERRFYLFEEQEISNSTTKSYDVYSLLNGDSTSFIFEAKDSYLNAYSEKLFSLLRWYPNLNEYKVVEMAKTDGDGKTVMKVKTEDVDYRIALYHLNGSLINLAEPIRMACLINPCTYTMTVNPSTANVFSLYDVETSLTYEENNSRFVFTWNDPTQDTNSMRLYVYKDAGFQIIELCNSTSSGFTGAMTCDAGNYTGKLVAKAYRTASPEVPIAIAYKELTTGIESSFGLFASFIIALLAGLIGIFSPVGAIIMLIVGLIPALLFGTINYAIFMGIASLGGIVIHYLRKLK